MLKLKQQASSAVRGIHFQPVSHFGRIPGELTDAVRFALDELLSEIERQTEGKIKMENLLPSRCDHPLCGFHGDFVVLPDNIKPLSRRRDGFEAGCCGESVSADQNRAFVIRRWERPKQEPPHSCCTNEQDIHDLDYFLRRIRTHGFLSAMVFQDARNIDLERLRRCSLHVFDQGRLVPFCAHYLSGWEQS